MTIEFSGCLTSGAPGSPICVLEPGEEVRVWARAAPGVDVRLQILPRGDRITGEDRAGGRLFRMSDLNAGQLEVVASEDKSTARFVLPIEQWERPRFFSEAREMARSGRFDEARSLVKHHLVGSSQDRWHGMALGLLARVERRSGRFEEARSLLRRAIREHRRRGDSSEEIADRCLSIHISYSDQGDFRTALRELEEMPLPSPGDADAAYLQAYYRGTLAQYTGDYRNALLLLNTAHEQREHLADAAGLGVVSQILARVLQRLGRPEDARNLFDRLISDPGYVNELDSCRRATLFTNVGWNRILELEAGLPTEDPVSILEEALDALGEGLSCRTASKASIQINLGFAFLHRGDIEAGDIEAATQHLEEARVDLGSASPRLLLWHLDLESRLDERQGHLERASSGFKRLQELAVVAVSPETEWRALFGQARVAETAGRPEEARQAYARAEALLDDISLHSPVGLGRATSMAAVESSTRSYLQFLLEQGLPEEALRVARRSRSRGLRGLISKERVAGLGPEERLEWSRSLARYETLAADLDRTLAEGWQKAGSQRKGEDLRRRQQREELRKSLDQAFALLDSVGLAEEAGPLVAADGEVILLFHPVVAGWAGFLVDSDGTRVERLGIVSREQPMGELSRSLLGPFQERLAAATQVRILSYGWLRNIDFHALQLGGTPLLSKASVVYGLDLPETVSSPLAAERNRALVVVDPTETLPAAVRETSIVTGRLRHRGLAVEQLAGSAAQRSQVLAGLEGSRVFHFAGHADSGGSLGDALRLANAGRLSASDVLTSSSVPSSVVLAACETGRSRRGAPGPALSLAEAYLVAGSREVLSTSRAVDDRAAAAMVAAIYRHWKGDLPLAKALRRAQLEPEILQNTDWAAFRALGR